MGLSGQRDKNGQTANKDRDHSTLTLNTLSLFSKESEESWRGEEGGGGRAAGRQIGREWVSGTRGRWGDKRDGEPGEKEEKRGINKSESRGRERKRDRGSIWWNECQGETVQTHQMVAIATTSPVSLFLFYTHTLCLSLSLCLVALLLL